MSPRSAQTNERMRTESRERIVAAALEVFTEKGHDATVSEITARAGVSRGLLTYYFPGKDELVTELLRRYLDRLLTIVDIAGETPDHTLALIIDRFIEAIAATRPIQRVMLSLMTHPSTHPLFAQVEAMLTEQLTKFEAILRDVFAQRGADDPALEEVLFRSVIEGVTFKASVYPDTYPLEHVRVRLHEMYGLDAPATPLLDDVPAPGTRLRVLDNTAESR
jgi:AcrR family transcriptional regulator